MSKEKLYNDAHHPITNGKTKQMIFASLVFLFLIVVILSTYAFTLSFHLTGLSLWIKVGSYMSSVAVAIGGIVYAVHSFFDTREAQQKAQDKLEMKKAILNYKLEKYKLKHGKI